MEKDKCMYCEKELKTYEEIRKWLCKECESKKYDNDDLIEDQHWGELK